MTPRIHIGFFLALTLASTLLACGDDSVREGTPTSPQSAAPSPAVAAGSNSSMSSLETPTSMPQPTPALTGGSATPEIAALPASLVVDPHSSLSAYEEVLVGIYESILPSVVQVQVRTNLPVGGLFGTELRPVPSEGSGFVWSAEGHIVTNHHVIEDADRVVAVFADGLELVAETVGSDPDSDLAVLKVRSTRRGSHTGQQRATATSFG